MNGLTDQVREFYSTEFSILKLSRRKFSQLYQQFLPLL